MSQWSLRELEAIYFKLLIKAKNVSVTYITIIPLWREQRRYVVTTLGDSLGRETGEPERPGRVAAEGTSLFRKEGDRNEAMLIRPQQVHESSTNATSAC